MSAFPDNRRGDLQTEAARVLIRFFFPYARQKVLCLHFDGLLLVLFLFFGIGAGSRSDCNVASSLEKNKPGKASRNGENSFLALRLWLRQLGKILSLTVWLT